MPVNSRYFTKLSDKSVKELATLCGGELVQGSGELLISEPASATQAGAGQIAFFEGRAKDSNKISRATACCIVKASVAATLAETDMAIIVHEYPRSAHILAAQSLYELKNWDAKGKPAQIHADAKVHPSTTLCNDVEIGAHTIIGPNCYIGPGVSIGAGCSIAANVTIECAQIGNHVNLLPGVHIGQAGFGVTIGPNGPEDIPQWGSAILGDHVTIGAGSCVDRGAFDDTIIGARTKIDNLCQIAHNVVVGENVRIASFSGISGSSSVGDNTVMGGGVGIADHVHIGANVQLLARSGLMHDVPDGERWGGYPARPWRAFFRETVWLQQQASKKS